MSGRTVIITGASSGIGETLARAFGRGNDHVVMAARRVDRLNALAAELPDSLVVPADLTRSEDIARVAEAALARYGRIDVLVNNAGLGRYDWLERLPEEDILNEIRVNLQAPILMARAVLPAMQRQGRGVIINVCSIAGKIGAPTTSIYNATKFGLDGFSQALRRELLPQGIHVCVIYPGPTAGTEFGSHAPRVNLGVSSPAWLRTSTATVARAIAEMADRPRARRVIPGFYGVMIAINSLLPWLGDRVTARAVARARTASAGVGPTGGDPRINKSD
jgi:short-subunit dehydrogenase